MKTTATKLSALTAALLAGGAMFATLPASALSFVSAQAAGEQSSSSLIGLRVENTEGENLGDINYLVLDANGNVTTAVIGVGGFLGIGEKNVGVPFKDLKMGNNKNGTRVAMVTATKDTLTAAPNYVWNEKSTTGAATEPMTTPAVKPAPVPAPAPTQTP